jgi:2-polyprenyl-6-methoxyphenol hydroxylase-like FAD-dependent oxidoreductase
MEPAPSVLVIGGGTVGLFTGLLLARQDVEVLVVERHPGPSPHPRAIGVGVRTGEIRREVGLDGFISWRARTAPPDPRGALGAALRQVLAMPERDSLHA